MNTNQPDASGNIEFEAVVLGLAESGILDGPIRTAESRILSRYRPTAGRVARATDSDRDVFIGNGSEWLRVKEAVGSDLWSISTASLNGVKRIRS